MANIEGFTTEAKAPRVDTNQDLLVGYTSDEKDMIQDFISRKVLKAMFHKSSADTSPTAIFIGGFLGAGKSHMGYEIAKSNSTFCLIDVNDVCLCELEGYILDYNNNGFDTAYNYWRNASNYIAQELTKIMTDNLCNFISVGTATGGHIPSQFQNLLEKGFRLDLKSCVTPLEVSRNNIQCANRFSYLDKPPAASFELPPEHLVKNKDWSARAIFFKQLAMENHQFSFEQYVLRQHPSGKFEHILAFKIKNGIFTQVDESACSEYLKICCESHGILPKATNIIRQLTFA